MITEGVNLKISAERPNHDAVQIASVVWTGSETIDLVPFDNGGQCNVTALSPGRHLITAEIEIVIDQVKTPAV